MIVHQKVIGIIDDDPGMRNAMEDLLLAHGYRTEIYGSAEEFLNGAITSEAACLLVDIQLGDLSGIELGRLLAATCCEFPIIFMTGSRNETFRRQAFDFGCVAYLQKPFPVVQLIEAVTKAIGSIPSCQ
jgi:FixJ family two-component response regulator